MADTLPTGTGIDEALRQRRETFHQRLRALHLSEGFSYDDDGQFQSRPYWPLEPRNGVRPHLWAWPEVREAVRASGDLVGLGRGASSYDRRVVALTNPGLGGERALTTTLFGDIQLIRPGEGAPSHRHTPCAARFIFEGRGWTSVAGERVHFEPGDVVFTGPFTWHDHRNSGTEDLLFLDVLDIPLMQYLGASMWEFDYESVTGSPQDIHHPVSAVDYPHELFTGSGLRPRFPLAWERDPGDFGIHRWSRVRPALEAMAGERGSPWDGILVEFTHTLTGGPVGHTMSIFTQLLRPEERTLAHRHTSSTICVGVEGRGATVIDGETFTWGPSDIFVVPSWAWHEHHNLGQGPAVLHSISDASLLGKLGMWREQRRGPDGAISDSGWTRAPLEDF